MYVNRLEAECSYLKAICHSLGGAEGEQLIRINKLVAWIINVFFPRRRVSLIWTLSYTNKAPWIILMNLSGLWGQEGRHAAIKLSSVLNRLVFEWLPRRQMMFVLRFPLSEERPFRDSFEPPFIVKKTSPFVFFGLHLSHCYNQSLSSYCGFRKNLLPEGLLAECISIKFSSLSNPSPKINFLSPRKVSKKNILCIYYPCFYFLPLTFF